MARLWDVVDGEPFFINPQLLIAGTNPRRKKGKKSMARRISRKRGRGRKNAPRRRRVSRSRAKVAIYNPRRKRSRRNPVHRKARRRGYRRNPALLGFQLPPLMPVVYAGAGFVAPPVVEGFLAGFLPTEFAASTLGKYATRFASVIGGTWLVQRFVGRNAAMYFGIGGGAYILTSAIREFMPGVIPGLGAYTVAGQTAVPFQLGAYTRQLGQGGEPWAGGMTIQRSGGTGTVPMRLRRFQ